MSNTPNIMIENISVSTKYSKMSAASMIEHLRSGPENLKRLHDLLGTKDPAFPLDEGERTFIEVLVHLINCEARTSEAIVSALSADEPKLIKIHPEKDFGKFMKFDRLSVENLLFYFSMRRTVLLNLLDQLTDLQWARKIIEEDRKQQKTIYLLSRSMAHHENSHLIWMESKIRK